MKKLITIGLMTLLLCTLAIAAGNGMGIGAPIDYGEVHKSETHTATLSLFPFNTQWYPYTSIPPDRDAIINITTTSPHLTFEAPKVVPINQYSYHTITLNVPRNMDFEHYAFRICGYFIGDTVEGLYSGFITGACRDINYTVVPGRPRPEYIQWKTRTISR